MIMRISLLDPEGDLTPDLVSDSLLLLEARDHRTAAQLRSLSALELHLIYDWAMREHIAAAGNQVLRRPRPHLLELTSGDDDSGPSGFDRPEVVEALRRQDAGVIGEQAKTIAELTAQNDDLAQRLHQAQSELEEAQGAVIDLAESVH